MSPNNPSNFVSDLVEMAKAFEELPRVREALDLANDAIEDYAKQVQRLEMRHIERTAELDALNSRIRSLEVERDEAQFHALEADDRTARALDFIKATFGNAGSLIQALEPPRVDAPQPVDATTESVTNPDETAPKPYLEQTSEGVPFRTIYDPNTASQPAPEVVASPDPTPIADAVSPEVHPVASPAAGATDTAMSASIGEAPTGPAPNAYAGRTYSGLLRENPYAFSLTKAEWIAGGGTEDNWWA